MGMDKTTVRENAKKIYSSGKLDNIIFTVDNRGKLGTISKFNLLGRFIHWFRGKVSSESNREKTCRAFDATIKGMIALCDPKKHLIKDLMGNYVDCPHATMAVHYSSVITTISKSKKYRHLAANAEETLEEMRKTAQLSYFLNRGPRF